ncbi:hypothetical protein B0H63DRAFT_255437 [Podospora didyma]|uniref:F-box domain-containing protein n=1 Tax=Podospora didyma TaxID=330526 RepID=A0AAE0KDT3_9PEZI|nr:hypothetical protein B0H63DRAFT_255437 [Podospora didyma]
MADPSPLTFLNLPEPARLSVYTLAGLVRPCPIDLLDTNTGELRSDGFHDGCWYVKRLRGVGASVEPGTRLCSCPQFPLALTLVSRQVRHEALDVLMSCNLFVVRVREGRPEMLAPLLTQIPAPHFARLTHLVIRLNCWPCPFGHDGLLSNMPENKCPLCGTDTKRGDPILSRSSPRSQLLLEAWEQVCRRLGSARLANLTLICDVDANDGDSYIISHLLGPLINYLPPLRNCNIRLGRSPTETNLASMARETALTLTRQSRPIGEPFPFGRLPIELKLLVLRYTHLGPPELAGYDHDFTRLHILNGRLTSRRLRGVSSRPMEKCCSACTVTFMDCCCPSSHASYSRTCGCRVLPMALFLVDRDTRLAAIQAFYPGSIFTLRHDNFASVLDVFPRIALPLLRNVTFELNPMQCYYWTGGAPTREHLPRHFAQISAAHSPTLPPGYNPSADFRAVLSALAARSYEDGSDTAPLALELDLLSPHVFVDLFIGDMDEDDEEQFRWTYDLYIDVARAVRESFQDTGGRLSSVRFRLATFTDLEPWLEREVLGERFVGTVQPATKGPRRILTERVPKYHVSEQGNSTTGN